MYKLRILIIFLLASIANQSARAGKFDLYFSKDAWTIYKSDIDCSLFLRYENNDLIILELNGYTNLIKMSIFSERFRSVKSSDEHKLKVLFYKKGYIDDGWGEKKFIGMRFGEKGGVTTNLDAKDLLKDFSIYEGLAIEKDDILVGSYSLDGSSLMVSKLKICDAEVEKENPTDPFSGTREDRSQEEETDEIPST